MLCEGCYETETPKPIEVAIIGVAGVFYVCSNACVKIIRERYERPPPRIAGRPGSAGSKTTFPEEEATNPGFKRPKKEAE